jgi:hypothetical protein
MGIQFKKSRAEVIAEIVREADARTVSEPITRSEAIAILERDIEIHRKYIEAEWDDPNVTGTDEWHRIWIKRYSQIISLIGRLHEKR